MKVIACVVVWRAERFIRPVLDAAVMGTDEVWVALAREPYHGASTRAPDRTEEWVRGYAADGCNELQRRDFHIVEGTWSTEHDQRNALLAKIRKTPQPPDTFIAVIDSDEVYDPEQLRGARNFLLDTDMVSVPQRVYFKHGNWLVVPEDAHPPADVFMRLDGLRFIDCRCNNMNDWTPPARRVVIPRSRLEVHHMNTVGTLEEIQVKHETHVHASSINVGAWLATWQRATIESKNLHQTMPELLPGLRRVRPHELPPHLFHYGHGTLHLDDEAARWWGA